MKIKNARLSTDFYMQSETSSSVELSDAFLAKLNRLGNECSATISATASFGLSGISLGDYSINSGTRNVALGSNSVAIGEDNYALGTDSFAVGDGQNFAGMLGFKILDIDYENNIFTLDALSSDITTNYVQLKNKYTHVKQLPKNTEMFLYTRGNFDDLSVKQYVRYANIVSEENCQISVAFEKPGYKMTWKPDYAVFLRYTYLGTHEVGGSGACSIGYANSSNEDAVALGCSNKALERYAIALGLNNRVGMNAIAIGGGNTALARGAIAMGGWVNADSPSNCNYEANAVVEAQSAFAWSGRNGKYVVPANRSSTFNINPVGGIDGIYIGNERLSDIIQKMIANAISKA